MVLEKLISVCLKYELWSKLRYTQKANPIYHRSKKKKREIRKHLEGNIRENLCDFWLSNDFLHTKSKQYIKEQIDKLDCIKMKKLCSKQHH